MRFYRCDGIIIRSRDMGEADKLLTIFTRQFGKIRVLAKGARKTKSRFGSSTELLTHCDLLIYGDEKRELHIISGHSIRSSNYRLREDIGRLLFGLQVAEIVDLLSPEREENAEAFGILREAVEALDGTDIPPFNIFASASLKLLRAFGYDMAIDICPICQGRIGVGKVGFDPSAGGFVCEGCFLSGRGRFASPPALMAMRGFRDMEIAKSGRIRIQERVEREIGSFIVEYVEHITGKAMKSPGIHTSLHVYGS
jgi:DNA repair protein RecO (recombination protein O)